MSVVSAAVYIPEPTDSSSGVIQFVAHNEESNLVHLQMPFVLVDEGALISPQTHYVRADTVTARVEAAPTVAGLVVSGLPDPCVARLADGIPIPFTGGAYTMAAPGVVTFQALGFLDHTLDITG